MRILTVMFLICFLLGCESRPLVEEGKKTRLSKEDAAELASKLANDRVERQHKCRPFKPDSFKIELRKGKWVWGECDPMGVKGYSAIVSFNLDGSEPDVMVFLPADQRPPMQTQQERDTIKRPDELK